jgi:hypothetical protein
MRIVGGVYGNSIAKTDPQTKGNEAITEFYAMTSEFLKTYAGDEVGSAQFSPGEFKTMAEVLKKMAPEIAVATPEAAGEFLSYVNKIIDDWSRWSNGNENAAEYVQPVALLRRAYDELVAHRNELNTKRWSDKIDTIP